MGVSQTPDQDLAQDAPSGLEGRTSPASGPRGGNQRGNGFRQCQLKAGEEGASGEPSGDVQDLAAEGTAGPGGALPFLDLIQASFGRHDISSIDSHQDGAAAASSDALGAAAFATGEDVAFGGAPDLHTAAHEAAHVVQQRSGVQLPGGVGQAGDPYEVHADAVADKVVAGESAEALLDQFGTEQRPGAGESVQCRAKGGQPVQMDPGGGGLTWEEAFPVVRAIVAILNRYYEISDKGEFVSLGHPDNHKGVPAKYKSLLWEWYQITHGTLKWKDGTETITRGKDLEVHLDRAVAETAPLTKTLMKHGDARTGPWLASKYEANVKKFRKRALQEEVDDDIKAGMAKVKEQGSSDLDFASKSTDLKLRLAASQGLTTVRAALTVAVRVSGANAKEAKLMEEAFAKGFPQSATDTGLAATKSMNVVNALLHVQGGFNAVNAILNVSDPAKRAALYRQHTKRFGPAAGTAEILKNLGQFVSGATAVVGAGTYAIASALGKAQLAAKALAVGGKALSKINVALNALAVVHGIAVLVNDKATAEEKAEAAVETTSGGLGLLGTFVPTIAAPCAAISASVLINFYSFKGILGAGLAAFKGMIQLGLNICYADMLESANYISSQAMMTAVSMDLASQETDPAKKQLFQSAATASRWNLTKVFLEPFIKRATSPRGGGNSAPGTYAVLRKRFAPLQNMPSKTDAEVFALVKSLLETVLGCQKDAQKIMEQQAYHTWKNH